MGFLPRFLKTAAAAIALTGAISAFHAPVSAAADAPDYNRALVMTREILSRPNVRKFLNELFDRELQESVALVQDGAISAEGKDKIVRKALSETQLLFLVDRHGNEIRGFLDAYLKFEAANPSFIGKTAAEFTDAKDKAGFEAFNKDRLALRKQVREFIDKSDIREGLLKYADPLSPYELLGDDAKPAIRSSRMYFNFPHYAGDDLAALAPADDLKQVALEFVRGTKKQGAINVFDFDLTDVADEIIKSAKDGRAWTIGIDEGVLKARPEVREVFFKLIGVDASKLDEAAQLKYLAEYYDRSLSPEFMADTGIKVRPIRSTGLNHQKLFTRDWTLPGQGTVLKSTGNLTQSCIGREGDLRELCRLYENVEPAKRPPGVTQALEMSKPNANIMVLTSSDAEAQLIRHQIAKATDLNLVGTSEYYIDGIYEMKMASTHPAQKGVSVVRAAFTPNGASGDVGRHFLGRAILEGEGPLRMANFVAANPHIREAIIQRIKKAFADGKTFEFLSITEKQFALQFYSDVLHLAGLEVRERDGKKYYAEIPDNPLRKVMGDKAFDTFRSRIIVPPRVYGTYATGMMQDGKEIQTTAKMHLKSFTQGDLTRPERMMSYLGSFNLSTGALTNQEYSYLYYDVGMTQQLNGGYKYLEEQARKDLKGNAPVHMQAEKRNKRGGVVEQLDTNPDAKKRDPAAAAARSKTEGVAVTFKGCGERFSKLARKGRAK